MFNKPAGFSAGFVFAWRHRQQLRCSTMKIIKLVLPGSRSATLVQY
jgi:hypothetical protein